MSYAIALITLHAGYSHSSLALRSIAAFCRNEAFYSGIKIHEPQVKANLHNVLTGIAQQQPALVGFSTYLWNIQASLHLAALIKKLLPDCRIVFGGPEAGPRGVELLEHHQAIDFIIDGEGEHAFRDLARRLLEGHGKFETISGLLWRDDGQIRINPITTIPPEQLVSPLATGLADLDKPLIYWETSRGCPFRCTFCTSATARLRMLPMETIENDLAVLSGLENKTVKLLDRSFHLGRERTLALLQRFLDTPESLRFHLELNPDRISAEALAIFAAAPPGKFQFEIGLQSLDDSVLARIDRAMTVDKGLANIRELVALRKHPVHLDLIIGLPGETGTMCRASLDKTFLLHPDHLQLGTLKLLPGTPLLAQAEHYGYIWDEEPPYEILCHEQLTFAEMTRFKYFAELLERLWNSGLLVHTLQHLVGMHYGNSLSSLFDALLDFSRNRLAIENMQPDTLFEHIIDFLRPALDMDSPLSELLCWDYLHLAIPGNKSPAWIIEKLTSSTVIQLDGSRRRLPLIELTEPALTVINSRRLTRLEQGRYATWPQKHQRGKPLKLFRVFDDLSEEITG